MLTRPERNEYADYGESYVAKVPEGSLLDFMAKQPAEYRQLLTGISDDAAAAPTAHGKWSIKQVLGHLCDGERVLSYRVLRFARGDEKELQGYEQDDYVREAGSNSRSLEDLLNEFDSVRKATLSLFASLPPGSETRGGIANGHPFTVRALAYLAAGHAQQHYELLKAHVGKQAHG
jgi:DinB superfamily